MKKSLLFILQTYRRFASPDTGVLRRKMPTCAFYPTCSEYSEQAIKKYGALKGLYLSVCRIGRCHPWRKEYFDPIP